MIGGKRLALLMGHIFLSVSGGNGATIHAGQRQEVQIGMVAAALGGRQRLDRMAIGQIPIDQEVERVDEFAKNSARSLSVPVATAWAIGPSHCASERGGRRLAPAQLAVALAAMKSAMNCWLEYSADCSTVAALRARSRLRPKRRGGRRRWSPRGRIALCQPRQAVRFQGRLPRCDGDLVRSSEKPLGGVEVVARCIAIAPASISTLRRAACRSEPDASQRASGLCGPIFGRSEIGSVGGRGERRFKLRKPQRPGGKVKQQQHVVVARMVLLARVDRLLAQRGGEPVLPLRTVERDQFESQPGEQIVGARLAGGFVAVCQGLAVAVDRQSRPSLHREHAGQVAFHLEASMLWGPNNLRYSGAASSNSAAAWA